MTENQSAIFQKVNALDELRTQAEKLEEDIDDLEKLEKKYERKNKALNSLSQKVEDTKSEYLNLRRWQALAAVLESDFPESRISTAVDELSKKLNDISEMKYDDFEDAEEIRALEDDFEKHRIEIQKCVREIQSAVESVSKIQLDQIKPTNTVLRIPDIGTEEQARTVQQFQSALSQIVRGELVNPDKLREHKNEYEDIEINIDYVAEQYGLSDDAAEELLDFLDNEAVTLHEIDSEVLSELTALEEFSKRLTIQFHEE